MHTKRQIAFIVKIVYTAMIIFLWYLFFHTFLYMLFPFFIGFFIAYLLRPIIRYLTSITGHETTWSIICIIVFYMTVGLLCVFLIMKGYAFLKDFIIHLPALYQSDIQPMIDQWILQLNQIIEDLDPTFIVQLQNLASSLESSLSSFITTLSSRIFVMLSNAATSLPNAFLSFSMALMSSFFFTKDYTKLLSFFLRQFPIRIRIILSKTSYQIKQSLQMYMIAYGKLMLITFIELWIGLSFLKVDHAIMLSLLIALFDFFPVLGTGGVMIPWIIFAYITMHPKLACGLLILLLIMTIVRNILEPQIVGKQFNLHPLFMLAGMYIGAKLFGVLGMLLAPFIFMIIKQLHEEDILHLYHK